MQAWALEVHAAGQMGRYEHEVMVRNEVVMQPCVPRVHAAGRTGRFLDGSARR